MAEDELEQFLTNSGIDALQVVVDRADVERGNIEPTLGILRRLFETNETVRRFRSSVDVVFHGYDEDPRELYDVEEVCRYIVLLDQVFPFWFFFAALDRGFLALLLLVECKHQKTPEGLIITNKDEWALLLERHFAAMNTIFDKYGLDENLNEPLSKAILTYYEKRAEASRIN